MKNTPLVSLRRFVLALGAATAFCSYAVPSASAKSDDLQANPVPAIGQNAEDQKAFDPAKKGPRVLFSQGFYIRPKLDAEKEAVAKKRGDVFVNMEDIRARKDAHSRFNHPGDLGMELIAERFWQHIEKRVRNVRR